MCIVICTECYYNNYYTLQSSSIHLKLSLSLPTHLTIYQIKYAKCQNWFYIQECIDALFSNSYSWTNFSSKLIQEPVLPSWALLLICWPELESSWRTIVGVIVFKFTATYNYIQRESWLNNNNNNVLQMNVVRYGMAW